MKLHLVILCFVFIALCSIGAYAADCTSGTAGFDHTMTCPFGLEHKTELKWLNKTVATDDITLTVGPNDDIGDKGIGMVFFHSTPTCAEVCPTTGCPGMPPACDEGCGMGVGFVTTIEIQGSQEEFDMFFPEGIQISGGFCTITKVNAKYPITVNTYWPGDIVAVATNPTYKPVGWFSAFPIRIETSYLFFEGCLVDKKVATGMIRVRVRQPVPDEAWLNDCTKFRPLPPHMQKIRRIFGPVEQADPEWFEFLNIPSDWPCSPSCECLQETITPVSSEFAAMTYYSVRVPSWEWAIGNYIAPFAARYGWDTHHDPFYFYRSLGSIGTIYYNCTTESSITPGLFVARNAEFCAPGQSRGNGTYLWQYTYDSSDNISQAYNGSTYGTSSRKYNFTRTQLPGGKEQTNIQFFQDGTLAREVYRTYDANDLLVCASDDKGVSSIEYYKTSDYNDARLNGLEKAVYNAAGDIARYDVYDTAKLNDPVWAGTPQPLLKSQYAVDNPQAIPEVIKLKDYIYDINDYSKTEFTWVSNNAAKCIKYYYKEASLATLIKQREYDALATSTSVPSGTFYDKNFSYDDGNSIKITTYPSGKRQDITEYNINKQPAKMYVRDTVSQLNANVTEKIYSGTSLYQEIDERGGVTEYSYTTINGSKFLSLKKLPQTASGRQEIGYQYDGACRVVLETRKDPNGQTTTTKYIYDGLSENITAKIEAFGTPNECVTINKYDGLGRLVRSKTAGGVVNGRSYNLLGQLTSEFVLADAADFNTPDSSLMLVSQISYIYNSDGKIETVRKAKDDGTFAFSQPEEWITTEYTYDFLGRKTAMTEDVNGLGLTTSYEYDNQGQLVKTVYPSGKWEKKVYNGRGLVSLEITGYQAANVLVTTYEYNEDGNLVRKSNADGTVECFAYDNFGRLIRKHKASLSGPYTRLEYDNAGQAVRETACDANGTVRMEMTMSYNVLGKIAMERQHATCGQQSNLLDRITITQYDICGNVKKIIRKGPGSAEPNSIEPNDIVLENFHDAFNRNYKTIDGQGLVTWYSYNPDGKLLAKIEPGNLRTENIYDAGGSLIKTINAENDYTAYCIDSLGRTIKQTTIDCNDTVSAADDRPLVQIRFEYDNLGRNTRKTVMRDPSSSAQVSVTTDMVQDWVYDETSGLLDKEKKYYNGNAIAVTHYYYDEIGRQIRIVDAQGNESRILFDSTHPGRKEKEEIVHCSDPNITVTTVFDYDDLGYLASATIDRASQADIVTTFEHDSMGRRVSETNPGGTVRLNVYDSFGNMIRTVRDWGGINAKTEYGFDRFGRKVCQTQYDPNAQITRFVYTKNDKLSAVIYPNGSSELYYYDEGGEVDQLVKRDGTSIYYSYDGLGRVLEECDSLTSPSFLAEYDYDGAGRLTWNKKTVSGQVIAEVAYMYNGFGLKETETVTYEGNSMNSISVDYEYDQAGNMISRSDDLTNSIVSYTHDGLGRIREVRKDSVKLAEYSYAGFDIKNVTCTEAGITCNSGFDDVARLNRITSTMGSETLLDLIYTHDAVSNRNSVKYNHLESPVFDLYTFDALGRLIYAQYGSESGFASAWQSGNMAVALALAQTWIAVPDVYAPILSLSQTDPNEGTDPNWSVEYTYDSQGQQTSRIVYDEIGRKISTTLYLSTGADIEILTSYETEPPTQMVRLYDAAGELVTEMVLGQRFAPRRQDFQSLSSQPMMMSQSSSQIFESQTMLMSGPAEASEEFVYDAMGNRTVYYGKITNVLTYWHNAMNQYTRIRKDFGMGMVIDVNQSCDQNGNLQTDGDGFTYTYDYAGRLSTVSAQGIVQSRYFYDCSGRMIKTMAGSETTYYYYDVMGHCFAEAKIAGSNLNLTKSYIHGQSKSPLVMLLPEVSGSIDSNDMQRLQGISQGWLCDSSSPSYDDDYDYDSSGLIDFRDMALMVNQFGWHSTMPGSDESQYYYLTDAAGSVASLIGGKYGRSEDREYYVYDVYGKTESESAIPNRFTFGSMRMDKLNNTFLLHDGSRVYNSVLGRYLQPAENCEFGNVYEFSGSNPVMQK